MSRYFDATFWRFSLAFMFVIAVALFVLMYTVGEAPGRMEEPLVIPPIEVAK